VVGVQPFGGHALSGTGPKAGGPLYLRRLLAENPPRTGLPNGAEPPAFRALLEFAVAEGAERVGCDAAGLVAFAEATPHGVRMELPGPVGEQNIYRLLPRGFVLCVAATRGGAMRQIAAALATGNRALVDCVEPFPALDRLPPALQAHIARGTSDTAEPVAVALFDGDAVALERLMAQLVDRSGPIVPVFAARDADAPTIAYPLEYLLAEQSISVNTAAAGGNASLMAIG
jgi:RHH-type proline utilization regulon transcriptional repressor/proline dehydrogenase/delta 1-pyrroline-5-carboxylate dehydrogenase